MPDDAEKLRKFHTVDLYIASIMAWLGILTVFGLLSYAIATHQRAYFWAAAPMGVFTFFSGQYENRLRKQLNDPLIDD